MLRVERLVARPRVDAIRRCEVRREPLVVESGRCPAGRREQAAPLHLTVALVRHFPDPAGRGQDLVDDLAAAFGRLAVEIPRWVPDVEREQAMRFVEGALASGGDVGHVFAPQCFPNSNSPPVAECGNGTTRSARLRIATTRRLHLGHRAALTATPPATARSRTR